MTTTPTRLVEDGSATSPGPGMTTLAETIEQSWIMPAETTSAATHRARRFDWSALLLVAIAAFQIVMATRAGYTKTAFEDEGLYVYEGHEMIAHLLHGFTIPTAPGSYFSGAPGLYPVISALGDSVGGLGGARFVSTILAIVAMVSVWGIGRELYGRVAGLTGAALFATCGPVIFISHLATYDMTMLALVTAATWYGVRGARRDGLMLVWLVSALLALAFFVKYAGALYVPLVFAVCIAAGWGRFRWLAVRQGLAGIALTATLILAALVTVGRSLVHGIKQTTLARSPMDWQSTSDMMHSAWQWVGPWYVLGAIGGLVTIVVWRGRRLVTVALLLASAAGIVEQIRMHEGTSFNKHVAFGLAFAAPVAGSAVQLLVGRYRSRGGALARLARAGGAALAAALIAVALSTLVPRGARTAMASLTAWPDDTRLVSTVRTTIARNPDAPVLGEKPSPERYALSSTVQPTKWADTYYFPYGGELGRPAYRQALEDGYFGTIYLSITTDFGAYVHSWLQSPVNTRYAFVAKVPRVLFGRTVGYWLVYTRQEAS
jgi:Dolichyl-phosphate-mannose-protein mannosyltransferase